MIVAVILALIFLGAAGSVISDRRAIRGYRSDVELRAEDSRRRLLAEIARHR